MTDEAQGVEVVAEGVIAAQKMDRHGVSDYFIEEVARYPGQDPTPVLIVRDTPEARQALGLDAREVGDA